MQNKISQPKKDKYCMITLNEVSVRVKCIEAESGLAVTRSEEEENMETYSSKDIGFQVCKMVNFQTSAIQHSSYN